MLIKSIKLYIFPTATIPYSSLAVKQKSEETKFSTTQKQKYHYILHVKWFAVWNNNNKKILKKTAINVT